MPLRFTATCSYLVSITSKATDAKRMLSAKCKLAVKGNNGKGEQLSLDCLGVFCRSLSSPLPSPLPIRASFHSEKGKQIARESRKSLVLVRDLQ